MHVPLLTQPFKEDCSDATDYLKIHDGNHTSSPILAILCGWRKVSDLRSTQNHLFLEMITSTQQHRGFLMDYFGEFFFNDNWINAMKLHVQE